MADKEEVKKEESSKPPEKTVDAFPATDERGVPYVNRFKEQERKTQELEAKLGQALSYLDQIRNPGPNPQAVSQQRLTQLATNPDGFVDEKVNSMVMQLRALEAQKWLESRKNWKPEYASSIGEIIRQEGLASDPVKRAQTAWELLKNRHPDFVAKKEAKREEELKRYQTAGPGRAASEPPGKEESELFEAIKGEKNFQKQAELMGKLSAMRAKRELGVDRLH